MYGYLLFTVTDILISVCTRYAQSSEHLFANFIYLFFYCCWLIDSTYFWSFPEVSYEFASTDVGDMVETVSLIYSIFFLVLCFLVIWYFIPSFDVLGLLLNILPLVFRKGSI